MELKMDLTKEYLSDKTEELTGKLRTYIIESIKEIQRYNKISDKEMAEILHASKEYYNCLLADTGTEPTVSLIASVIILSAGSINFNNILNTDVEYTVEDIKRYFQKIRNENREKKLKTFLELLNIDYDTLDGIDVCIEQLKALVENGKKEEN